MPFTFSHPALILPLTFLPRKWFSLTGLVIGSLTPDFEYFLRMKLQSIYSHTIGGLFWFDLPLGILLAFIFHDIVRNSLFDNLPLLLKRRLSRFKPFHWNHYFKNNWFVVIISLLIGAASHILWDGFTHEHGYFVESIQGLRNSIVIFGIEIPIFKIIQHSSTLIGGLFIVFVLIKMPSDEKLISKINLNYWVILSVITILIIAIRLASGLNYNLIGNLVVTAISATIISLILTPLFTRKRT